MSLKRTYSKWIGRCENCGRRAMCPVVIEGHPFCSGLFYTEWRCKKERRKGL